MGLPHPLPPSFPFPPPSTLQNPNYNHIKLFTFRPTPLPSTVLSFPPSPRPFRIPCATPIKRARPLTDIDGEFSSPRKKKRRLRLFLITSRLSLPFSLPASNIVDRGSSKIAVWAKQKALGRNLLRKAAILNRIRRNALPSSSASSCRPISTDVAPAAGSSGGGNDRGTEGVGIACVLDQEKEQKQLELARLAFLYGNHETHTRPVFQRPPNFPPATAVRTGNYWALSGSPNAGQRQGPRLSSTKSVPIPASVPGSVASSSSSSSSLGSSSVRQEKGKEKEGPKESETYTSPNELAYSSPNDLYTQPHPAPLPRPTYLPLPPSPLGLSNYDALDLEDDLHDPYSAFDDDEADDDDGGHSPFHHSGSSGSHSPFHRPGNSGSGGSLYEESATRSPPSFSLERDDDLAFGSPLTSISSATDSTLSSVQTPPPPRTVYSDFGILDPDEAVVGDYDGVDGADGVEAVWPVGSGEGGKGGTQQKRAGERRWR